jgi:hypothetical protein
MCHRESMCRGVHGRIADGVRAPGRSVRTVGCFTDGHGRAAPAACPGLDAGRRAGRASPCARLRSRVVSRDAGGWGKAGAQVARAVVRESVTVAGRSGPGLLARSRPGCPGRPIRAGMTPRCWGAVREQRPAQRLRRCGADGHGPGGRRRGPGRGHWSRGVPQLRACDGEAEDGRGWGWRRSGGRAVAWFELRHG